MLSNPIEKIVDYLHEVGDPLLTIAANVERNADALRQAEAEVVRCRRKLKESRRTAPGLRQTSLCCLGNRDG